MTALDIDLFAESSLRAPFDDYQRLRHAGSLVWLERPQVFAMGRFADVQAALRSPRTLVSGQGVGLSEAFNVSQGADTLMSDGELHHRLRTAVMRPLTPKALRPAREAFKALIAERVDALRGRGWFDAMSELAAFLPVQAVSHLVGLPSVGRERMLEWAGATFNLVGPDPRPADIALLDEARAFLASLGAETVADGSWAGELFAAVRAGALTLSEAMGAISAYVIPSLDTTILAKGHLLADLAGAPDEWALVKANPTLIPNAVTESVRRSAVIRWFSRVALEDYPAGETVLPKGQRVLLLYGSANRDERRYADPDRFDVRRDSRDHLAWGAGVHLCVGLNLARLEMEVLLEALVEANATLQVGQPTVGSNRGLYGFTRLPYRID